MKIAPPYDRGSMIRLDGVPSAVGPALTRQRRRLAAVLESLSREQWSAPSRCDEWRVQDVVAHLVGTNQFWNVSIQAGLAGNPTRILADFDPKATPAALVAAVRDERPSNTLAQFRDTTEQLCATVEALGPDEWNTLAESPAGHVTITALAHHALWDAWVHERDILEPLGDAADEDADEIVACVRYAAAISPALALQFEPARTGVMALTVSEPDARAVVIVDGDVAVTAGDPPDRAFVLTGGAVDVLEALSVRRPWRRPIPTEHAWMLAGLTDVFETEATCPSS